MFNENVQTHALSFFPFSKLYIFCTYILFTRIVDIKSSAGLINMNNPDMAVLQLLTVNVFACLEMLKKILLLENLKFKICSCK